MLKYIFTRVFMAILVIFFIASLTFWLSRAIPGGPFSRERPLSPLIIANLERKYNLDKPVFEQYLHFMKNVAMFDFGPSYLIPGETVNSIIARTFPVSCYLGIWAFLIAIVMGIPLGIISALMENKAPDAAIKVMTTLFITIPNFVVATMLMYFLGYKLRLLPPALWGTWRHAVMPIVALSALPLATVTKYMRSSMLEVLDAEYIRTARAKGAGSFTVHYVHALKNALLPILTVSGPMFVWIICGSVVIEQIFAVPGLGKQFTKAIFERDYSMIMGLTIFYATILIAITLLVDVLYSLVDPRIKISQGRKGLSGGEGA